MANLTETFYITLVRAARGWGAMRATRIGTKRPKATTGEVVVKVKLTVPRAAFEPLPVLTVADLVFQDADVARGEAEASVEPVAAEQAE